MKLDRIRAQVERLLATPGEELGRWARLLRFQVGLWRFCARRLRENNLAAMSAALSYRTIFALIPILVLSFLVLKSVGALEDSKRSLRNFLDASGFSQIVVLEEEAGPDSRPASAPTTQVVSVADQIENLVAEVESKLTFERIGPVGGALLIWTALTLLTTLESSLNRIFGAPRSRALTRRVLLYWSAMTLGPLAVAVTAYLGGNIIASCRDLPGVAWLLVGIGWAGPVVVGILLLAALYALVPNTHVRFRSALGGAAVAAVLWLAAKWAFARYVQHFVLTGNLYGVLGAVPLFLLWLNLSWMIFLFGAQLAHSAASMKDFRLKEEAEPHLLGPSDVLATAVAVGKAYQAGRAPVPIEQISRRLDLPGEAVERLLDALSRAGVVGEANDARHRGYVLLRPPETIPLLDLVRIGDPRGASEPACQDGDIAAALGRVGSRTRTALAGQTLADVLTDEPLEPATGETSSPRPDA